LDNILSAASNVLPQVSSTPVSTIQPSLNVIPLDNILSDTSNVLPKVSSTPVSTIQPSLNVIPLDNILSASSNVLMQINKQPIFNSLPQEIPKQTPLISLVNAVADVSTPSVTQATTPPVSNDLTSKPNVVTTGKLPNIDSLSKTEYTLASSLLKENYNNVIPSELVIEMHTRMPGIQTIYYYPQMTLPKIQGKYIHFNPYVELHKNIVDDVPPYESKDYLFKQFLDKDAHKTLINRTLNSYDQPMDRTIFEVSKKPLFGGPSIVQKNIDIILSVLFKKNNVLNIRGKQYTVFGYEQSNKGWYINNKYDKTHKMVNKERLKRLISFGEEVTGLSQENQVVPETQASEVTPPLIIQGKTESISQPDKKIEEDIYEIDFLMKDYQTLKSKIDSEEDLIQYIMDYKVSDITYNESNINDLAIIDELKIKLQNFNQNIRTLETKVFNDSDKKYFRTSNKIKKMMNELKDEGVKKQLKKRLMFHIYEHNYIVFYYIAHKEYLNKLKGIFESELQHLSDGDYNFDILKCHRLLNDYKKTYDVFCNEYVNVLKSLYNIFTTIYRLYTSSSPRIEDSVTLNNNSFEIKNIPEYKKYIKEQIEIEEKKCQEEKNKDKCIQIETEIEELKKSREYLSGLYTNLKIIPPFLIGESKGGADTKEDSKTYETNEQIYERKNKELSDRLEFQISRGKMTIHQASEELKKRERQRNTNEFSYYIKVNVDLYPGSSIPLEDYSSIICQSKGEKIREAWATMMGYQYAPGILVAPSMYKKPEEKQQANPNEQTQQANTNEQKQQANTNEQTQQANTNEQKLQANPNEQTQQSNPNEQTQQANPNEANEKKLSPL
jgi:hypothetical protein